MKGDFSRETFDRKKHYNGVLMQQGRVQLDADWNEQGDIDRYLFETEGTDVIGECGAPIGDAGFQITTDGTMLFIGAGRFYADGILVENDLDKLAYDDQSEVDLPGASLKDVLADMAERDRTLAIAYLDVWKRHVTALDDGRLREVALGGPDTTTRVKTVWQVRLLPVAALGPNADDIGRLEQEAEQAEQKIADLDTQLQAIDDNIARLREQLAAAPTPAVRARLEAAIARTTAQRAGVAANRAELVALLSALRKQIKDLRAQGRPDCSSKFPEWDALFAPHGTLNARAQPGDPSDDPCELPPGAGYTRLENQLYRVEVHKPGDVGVATFKWSRDNGTVVTSIEKISGSSVFVHDLGPDDVLGFANDQWVELSDDARELNGLPGVLARIVDIKPATNEIVLDPAPDPLAPGATGVALALHPKLRRWDQKDVAAAPANEGGVVTAPAWMPLEDGVEVEFSGGPFATGDYWLIPARTAIGDLEWPPYEVPNLAPQAQERRGIVHHRCRLALVEVSGQQVRLLEDCRKLFPPLTAIQSAVTPAAMHVIATSWENDGGINIQAFFKDGLSIRLDAPPDSASIDNDSILVTVDLPYVSSSGTATPNARERVILLGVTGISPTDPQTIVWKFAQVAPTRPVDMSTFAVNRTALRAAANLPEYRVNVTLRGRVIWRQTGRELIHLDGQAFAQPETDPATGKVRADLLLPSGDGASASDFESWFFLRSERPEMNTLRVSRVDLVRSFAGQADQVVASATEFPLNPDNPINLGPNDVFNRIRGTFTRSVQPEGEFPGNDPKSPVRLEFTPLRGTTVVFAAQVIVKGDTFDFRARNPEVISIPGTYRLIILSSAENDAGIRAADDDSALDGDFDGTAGASFTLPFTMDRGA